MTPSRPDAPIRVAHIIQNLNYGGMERVLHDLAERLPSHGFDTHIVVFEYLGHFASGLEDRVTFHQVPPMTRTSLIYPKQLMRLFRTLAPDIVHSHAGAWIQAARAARAVGVPAVVHTEHGRPSPVPLMDRLIDNHASRRTDVVISVSEALAGVLRAEVVHDPARVRVVTNGVNLDRLSPGTDRATIRMELGIPPDAFVIGSIGRLERVKNYALALRALAQLPALPDQSPPRLVLAGDGSERGALELLARELGIATRVTFLGWRQDAERLYGAFDLFTLPSRSEGTSISLLEAMSSEVCPVVTDVGGNRAVLGATLDSLLVPDNDVGALAAGWYRVMADPQRRAAYAADARRVVATRFSLDQMVDAHATLYRELHRDTSRRRP